MAKTLTAANAVLLIAISGLFDVPIQIQGFAADNVFDVDDIAPNEVLMGVDGKLSAGRTPVAIRQGYSVQADSDSIAFFEQWYEAEKAANDTFFAQGQTYLKSVDRKYVMVRGVLTGYSPLPAAQKLLQPRKFSITWESLSGSAI